MIMFNQPILVISECPDKFQTIINAFETTNLSNPLSRCVNAEDADDYLLMKGHYQDSVKTARPGVILLDMETLSRDGQHLLRTIKRNEKLKDIPVLVMHSPGKQKKNKGNGQTEIQADGYIESPFSFARFVQSVQGLKNHLLEIVVLPKR